jgi:subtilisin family serine protease
MIVKLPAHRTRYVLARNISKYDDWSYFQYKVEALHAAGLRGQGVKIAILDTGTNDAHPSLWGKTYKSFDLTGEGIQDQNGHGTWIHGRFSSIHNGFGPRGFAPDAEICVIKVLDKNGSGDLDQIAEGVKIAIDEGCHLINLSIGTPIYHKNLANAIRLAYSKNIVVAASAGNDFQNNHIDFPATMAETICVGSHNQRRHISRFSDTGVQMDVYAPGEDVLSTDLGNKYSYKDGTSMAVPTFLAVLACLKAGYLAEAEPFNAWEELINYISPLKM